MLPPPAVSQQCILPLDFSNAHRSPASAIYRTDPAVGLLLEFFDKKGLAALKAEDRAEAWYEDWIRFQAEHRIYASLLCPKRLSTRGSTLDLLRLTRFLEVFAWCSPAHGYSLQVSFLGFFSILLGTNEALKREAATLLEAGGLFAFGVSEQAHGADLLANEFAVREVADAPGERHFIANGRKYYIGNANCADMVTLLARKEDARSAGHARRAPMLMFALRPKTSPAFGELEKIHTMGIRAAHVGSFSVHDHAFSPADIVAEGRGAWDAVFGTVTLGKFFLGFGSVGICEHALVEATEHLQQRILYGKPALEMPHLKSIMAEARLRLTAMKLYAYRALDYVQAAGESEKRYLLYTAVQKARVSTEGVRVLALLLECIGARGFESSTYFEMALRDAPLIPGLEGSAHINLGMAAQFLARVLFGPVCTAPAPPSLLAADRASEENEYLMRAVTSSVADILFPAWQEPFRNFAHLDSIGRFMRQVESFRQALRDEAHAKQLLRDMQTAQAAGACISIIAYAQLIAENAALFSLDHETVAGIFTFLAIDFAASLANMRY